MCVYIHIHVLSLCHLFYEVINILSLCLLQSKNFTTCHLFHENKRAYHKNSINCTDSFICSSYK